MSALRRASALALAAAAGAALLAAGGRALSGDPPSPPDPDAKPPQAAPAKRLEPGEILDLVDDLYRSSSSRGRMRMDIHGESWDRSLEFEYWTQGKDRSLFRVLEPAQERGMATLRSGDDMYNFLPRTDRTIRLNSAMMGDSQAGSHFTNNDLVRESRFREDYTFAITFAGTRRGYHIIELTCTPKPDAPVEWGRVVLTVHEDSYLPMFAVYYDEDLSEARYLTYHEEKLLGGRRIPTVMRVIPAANRKESTTLTVLAAEYDIEIDPDVFSLRSLRR